MSEAALVRTFDGPRGLALAMVHVRARGRGFWIARRPIAVGELDLFAREIGVRRGFLAWLLTPRSAPATGVAWSEAQAFCSWTGLRLPTEEEWDESMRGAERRRAGAAERALLGFAGGNLGAGALGMTPGLLGAGERPSVHGVDRAGILEWCQGRALRGHGDAVGLRPVADESAFGDG